MKSLSVVAAAALVVAGTVVVKPSPAAAQDVLIRGRAQGVEAPASVLDQLRRDPSSFRFDFGWKAKARRIAQRRQALRGSGRPALTVSDMIQLAAVMTGVYDVPVIPGLYSDLSEPHTQAQLQGRIFGDGSGTVSVSELYTEMSRSVFTFDGAVAPWQPLPGNTAYYDDGSDFGRLWEFLRDALDLADATVDFGLYDNDGDDGVPNSGDDDGYVDTTAFLYATKAGSCGGNGIWPHRWNYRSARRVYGDGVSASYDTNDPAANGGVIQVHDYIVQSSFQCDGASLMGAGTMSHELGHALDLPDLYDTDSDDGTDSEGIGEWGLMGSGNHNRQTSPAHMSAWSKDQMGWVDVTDITTEQVGISLSSVQSTGEVLRVDLPGTEEFFLLSNRREEGSDVHLAKAGLLIWHIDPAKAQLSRGGVNEDANHKGVDLEEADGDDDLDLGNNRSDPGDPYPGSTGADEFTALSYPESNAYAGSFCTVGIRNIRESGSDILLDIHPSERHVLWGDTDGGRTLTDTDRSEAYEWALGHRDASQTSVANGDVDNDGDTDIRDGFIIQSHLDGIPAPGTRINTFGWLDCTPDPGPLAGRPTGTEQSPVRGGAGGSLP